MVKKLIFFDCHENYWKNHKKIKDSKYVNKNFFENFFDLFFGKKHEKNRKSSKNAKIVFKSSFSF